MTIDLDPDQKRRLEEAAKTIEELARETGESPADLLHESTVAPGNASGDVPAELRLTNLRGLGKEIWQGEDAQEYVNRLRDEWR